MAWLIKSQVPFLALWLGTAVVLLRNIMCRDVLTNDAPFEGPDLGLPVVVRVRVVLFKHGLPCVFRHSLELRCCFGGSREE